MGSDAEDLLSDVYDSEDEWSEEDDDIPIFGAGGPSFDR